MKREEKRLARLVKGDRQYMARRFAGIRQLANLLEYYWLTHSGAV